MFRRRQNTVKTSGKERKDLDRIVVLLSKMLESAQKENVSLKLALRVARPKILYARALKGTHQTISMAEMARLCSQAGDSTGRTRLMAWLRAKGWLCSQERSYNCPTGWASDRGYLEVTRHLIIAGGKEIFVNIPRVTSKGQVALLKARGLLKAQRPLSPQGFANVESVEAIETAKAIEASVGKGIPS